MGPATASLEPTPFELDADGVRLAGEELGEGPTLVLLHGITATRRYVVHGSKALPRAGYRLVSYDARAHGESDPAPEGSGYTPAELVGDLDGVIAERGAGAVVLCGHSMGCHTAAARALAHSGDLAGVVLIGPVNLGAPAPPDVLADWDRLADGLERDGVDGFMKAYEEQLDLDPEWRETVLRFTRERMERHRHPEALARAVREVPRSAPFDGIAALEAIDVPALVVASHDDADPGHPYAVAEAWSESLPQGRLISEERGEAPLAWRGGKLSRAIADFCADPAVVERLAP